MAAAPLVLLFSAALSAQTASPPAAWVESRGIRVHVPQGWSYNDRLVKASGPISMNNFAGVYASGGLLPPDGAEIEITSVPAPLNLTEYIQKELKGTKFEPLRETATGIQSSYVETFSGGGSLKTIVSYVAHGSSLYKFYLTYWTGNRGEPALAATFEKVMREAQLR